MALVRDGAGAVKDVLPPRAVLLLRPPGAPAIVRLRLPFSGFEPMTQTSNRLFDDFAKMMTDAAGAADGMKREVESMFKGQAERFLRDMDVVKREEFEAVKAMAQKAREENDAMSQRIAALEAALAGRKAV